MIFDLRVVELISGEEWTSELDASWIALLADLDGMVAERVANRNHMAIIDDLV